MFLVVSRNNINQASHFSEIETKFSKLKIVKNHSSILQFFLTYYLEQTKYETTSNKNVSFNFFRINTNKIEN